MMRWWAFALALPLPVCLLAQFPLVRSFELRPGQQRPRIHAIAQDERGLIWAASDLGLLRTDGHSTELVARVEAIAALATAGSDAVIATADGRVLRCSGERCDTLLADSVFSASRIRHLAVAEDGTVWIGARSAGLHRWKAGQRRAWRIADGLPDDHINGLALLPDGSAAVATDQGVAVVVGDSVRLRMSEADGAPDNLVLSIACDGTGSIWAGTDRGGVFRWRPGSDPVRIAQPWDFGAVDHLSVVGGMLWTLTTSSGLLAIDLELKRGIYRPGERLEREPRDLVRARDEALWWCDGTDVLYRADPAILVASEHEGIGLRDISAIAIDGKDRLWFAKGHRLFRHDARFSEESRLTEIKVPVDPLTPIVSLAAGGDGAVWAASFGSGVFAIAADGTVARFTMKDGLSNDNVLHARGTERGVLFATLNGITLKEGDAFTRTGREAGFVFDALAADGTIYMATDGKGVRYERGAERGMASGEERTYYALHRTADGMVWSVGPSTGFCALSAEGESCQAAGSAPFDGDLYALAEAGGRLLAFGSTGTLAFNPATGTATEVSVAFGLEGATAELGTAASDGQGALWLACSAGLLRMQPQPRHFAQQVPAFLTAVSLDGQAVRADAAIAAPHDRSALVIGFTAAYWTDPEALRFQYRLAGFSNRVTETRDRQAAFPELPPGSYAFQVRAFVGAPEDDAPWTEIAITINPPWWRRPWVLGGFALLLAGVVFLAIRARDRRMLYRQRMEEEKVRFQLDALRSQVDPHFLFNSFNALVELIESEPDKAVGHVEQLSTFFRNILQVRDHERITLREELRLLDTYFALEKRRFGDSIALELDVDEAAMQRAIVPLTLQLLVENALKHNVVAGGLFVIGIAAVGEEVVVNNPMRPRATPPRSTGFGLESIIKHYKALTPHPITVTAVHGNFIVRIPLIDPVP